MCYRRAAMIYRASIHQFFRRGRRMFAAGTMLWCVCSIYSYAQEADPDTDAAFAEFLLDFREEAVAKGIRPATLDAVLPGITLTRQAIAADRNQPEFKNTFAIYLERVS